MAGGRVHRCELAGGDVTPGDPGGRSVSGQGALWSGLDRVIAGKYPGVATAVQQYGEGDGGKEERLELRARQPRSGRAGVRAGSQRGRG